MRPTPYVASQVVLKVSNRLNYEWFTGKYESGAMEKRRSAIQLLGMQGTGRPAQFSWMNSTLYVAALGRVKATLAFKNRRLRCFRDAVFQPLRRNLSNGLARVWEVKKIPLEKLKGPVIMADFFEAKKKSGIQPT